MVIAWRTAIRDWWVVGVAYWAWIRTQNTKGEASLYKRIQRMRDVEKTLDHRDWSVQRCERLARGIRVLALRFLKEGRKAREEAISWVEEFGVRQPEIVECALQGLWRNGDKKKVESILTQARNEGQVNSRIKKWQKKISKRKNDRGAGKERESVEALRRLKCGDESGWLKLAEKAVRRVYDTRINGDYLSEIAGGLYRIYHGYCEKKSGGSVRALRQSESNTVPTFVFCGGFGWSGSGAVYDYLACRGRVLCPGNERELKFFDSPLYGLRGLSKAMGQSRQELRSAIFRFFWGGMLGLPVTQSAEERDRSERTKYSLLYLWKEENREVSEFLPQMARFVLAMEHEIAGDVEPERFEGVVGGAIGQFFRELYGQQRLLLNNAVHGQFVDVLRFFEKYKYFAVIRDVRDQYVAKRVEGLHRDERESFGEFVESTRRKVDRFAKHLKRIEYSGRVKVVGFEEFVTKKRVRESVLKDAGVSKKGWGRICEHLISRSRNNIGIWQEHYPAMGSAEQKEMAAGSQKPELAKLVPHDCVY